MQLVTVHSSPGPPEIASLTAATRLASVRRLELQARLAATHRCPWPLRAAAIDMDMQT